jgi:peptidoglycan hydrolase CwlO-like protein
MRSLLIRINTILIISILLLGITPLSVKAGLQEDLQEVQRKLQEIRNEKNNIQSKVNSDKSLQNAYSAEIFKLQSQIDLLDNEIQEKELIIQELNLQIEILTQNIETTTKQIEQARLDIGILEEETDKRLVDIYIDEKTFSQIDMFFSPQGTDIIKYSVYQNSFQMETNAMLSNLNFQKQELESKQVELETNKTQVISDQTTLEEEKQILSSKQTELDQQRAVFYKKRNEVTASIQQNNNLINIYTEEEQKTLAMQNKIEQELFNNIQNLGSGTYVLKGTIIGRQGYSGYVIPSGPAGAHLHFGTKINGSSVNPCSLLPSGVISGCGGNGSIDWPLRSPFYYTSSYGWRWGKWHDAIDIASPNTHAYIYAAHDGWMYKGGSQSSGYWRKVCETKDNCNQGKYSFYLHLAE